MTVAPARPAATVVVIRDAHLHGPSEDSAIEVLMVRRNDKVAFMAGAYVFPGGRVDEDDLAQASGDDTLAFRFAAARELHEEAGVRVDPSDLVPVAHWVTPEIEIRRYDTRFFLVPMPPGQEARHDAGETTALVWLTPAEALARCRRDEIMLPPPTWTTLTRLQPHRSVAAVVQWARTLAIPRVQPHFVKDERQTMLTLPGDPTYPTIEGWDVPEDTRFLLEDGRWRPARA